jgi:hypothetical protein
MPQDPPVTPKDVVAWIHESLDDCRGAYEVQVLRFVKMTVRVLTPRHDAYFDVEAGRWGALNDPEGRPVLTDDLKEWARRHLSR